LLEDALSAAEMAKGDGEALREQKEKTDKEN